MPIVMNVAGILSLTDDDIIPVCRGTLEQVYEYKSGTSQAGKPYSYQDLKLTDETGSIKLKLWGREAVPKEAKGKIVQLAAVKGKNGWAGLLRKTYKGTPLIDASEKAEFVWYTDEVTPEEQAAREAAPSNSIPPGVEPPAQAPAQARHNSEHGIQGPYPSESGTLSMATGNRPPENDGAAPVHPPKRSRETEAMEVFTQLANAQYAAVRVVREYLVPLLAAKGHVLDPVQESALIQNMLIQGYRHNVNMMFRTSKMPLGESKVAVPNPDDPDWNA